MQEIEELSAFVRVKLTPLPQYGNGQKGLTVCERVKKGTKLWSRMVADKSVFTREELEIMKVNRPDLADNIDSFSCQSGHDLFTIPTAALETEKTIDFRQYVNHSCSPNCGYFTEEGQTFTIAIKDIEVGEELTIHYGMLETEISFTCDLVCRCGSEKCAKIWSMNLYRTNSELLKYAKPELVKQIEEMRTKFWYSDKCWLKRDSGESNIPIKERNLRLYARKCINPNEMVARFVDGTPRYITIGTTGTERNTITSNCILRDGCVISKKTIDSGEEIIYPSQ